MSRSSARGLLESSPKALGSPEDLHARPETAVRLGPLCRLEVNQAPAMIVRYSQLFQVVLELGKKHRMAPATAAQLAHTLTTSQKRGAGEAGQRSLTVAS